MGSSKPQQLAVQHLDLVRSIAKQLIRRVPPSVLFEDLLASGYVGLMQAANNYKPSRKVAFSIYAAPRIRGSMVDSLRDRDDVSRGARGFIKLASKRSQEFFQQHGRSPEPFELARSMGLTIEKFTQRSEQSHFAVDSVEPDRLALAADTRPDAADLFAKAERDMWLRRNIQRLPLRLGKIMHLYYVEGMLGTEIGLIMDVTESRICQILAEGRTLLRKAARE